MLCWETWCEEKEGTVYPDSLFFNKAHLGTMAEYKMCFYIHMPPPYVWPFSKPVLIPAVDKQGPASLYPSAHLYLWSITVELIDTEPVTPSWWGVNLAGFCPCCAGPRGIGGSFWLMGSSELMGSPSAWERSGTIWLFLECDLSTSAVFWVNFGPGTMLCVWGRSGGNRSMSWQCLLVQ